MRRRTKRCDATPGRGHHAWPRCKCKAFSTAAELSGQLHDSRACGMQTIKALKVELKQKEAELDSVNSKLAETSQSLAKRLESINQYRRASNDLRAKLTQNEALQKARCSRLCIFLGTAWATTCIPAPAARQRAIRARRRLCICFCSL